MVNIIEELVKIEDKAETIIQDSEEARKALPKRISDFEEETAKGREAEYQKQVKFMQDNMAVELKAKLAEVEASGLRKSIALEKGFSENRSAWENQIVRKILHSYGGDGVEYEGIDTKIRAMQAHLLKKEDFEALSRLKSVEECGQRLKEYRDYSKIMKDIPPEDMRREFIEQKIRLSLSDDFSRLYTFLCDFDARNFLNGYFLKNEIFVLKTLLNMVFDEREIVYTMPELTALFGRKMQINIQKLKTSKTVPELIENLNGTEFYNLLTTVYDEKSSLFELEIQLDLYYYTQLWSAIDELDSVNREIMRKLIGTEMDLKNIVWLYRLKKYFRLPETALYGYLIPYTYLLDKRKLMRITESKTMEDFFTEVHATQYGGFFSAAVKPEKSLHVYMNRVLFELKRGTENSLGAVAAYLQYKEQEIDNITSLLECIRYGLEPAETMRYLTLPQEMEVRT